MPLLVSGKSKKTTSDLQLFKLLSSWLLCNPGALLCVLCTLHCANLCGRTTQSFARNLFHQSKGSQRFSQLFWPIKSQSVGFLNFVDQSKFQGPTKMSPSSVCFFQKIILSFDFLCLQFRTQMFNNLACSRSNQAMCNGFIHYTSLIRIEDPRP